MASSGPCRKARFSGPFGARDALVPVVLRSAQVSFVRRLVVAEDAQDVIEYALLAGLISLVAVSIVLNVGTGVNSIWTGVGSTIGSIPTP